MDKEWTQLAWLTHSGGAQQNLWRSVPKGDHCGCVFPLVVVERTSQPPVANLLNVNTRPQAYVLEGEYILQESNHVLSKVQRQATPPWGYTAESNLAGTEGFHQRLNRRFTPGYNWRSGNPP